MGAEVSTVKADLRKAILDAYREEYKELADTWRGLETKAQGNVAIAGIFIAGVFAFIRDIDNAAFCIEKCALTIIILCLAGSVIYSVLALKIRNVAAPPLGKNFHEMASDIFNIDGDLNERLPSLANDQIRLWQSANNKIEEANKLKADHLNRAQLCLLCAILIVASILIIKINF